MSNNHGGKRSNSGAPKNEGAVHKVPLSLEEKINLENLYPEVKTIPKRVKEAVEDIVKYKTEVKKIANVSMEIFNGEEGKMQFYVYDEGKNIDENTVMDIEKFFQCKNICYYKHSGRFEIDILMGVYIVGNTKEAREINEIRQDLKRLKGSATNISEILSLDKKYFSFLSEGLDKLKLSFGEDVFSMSFNFGEKYNEKVIVFRDALWDLKNRLRNIKDDYYEKDWLNKNFDNRFKEKLRERVSQEQLDNHIKYDELLELIKEDIAMKTIEYYTPKFMINRLINDISNLKTKINNGNKKLKILEARKLELEGLTNPDLDIDDIRQMINKEIKEITNKIDQFDKKLVKGKEILKQHEKHNTKLEKAGVTTSQIKFKWENFLSKDQMDFINRQEEKLDQQTNILNSLKRISKKIEKDINILNGTKVEIPSSILDEYMTLSLAYLEKFHKLKGRKMFDREFESQMLNMRFSKGNYDIERPYFEKYDESLGIVLDFYTCYPDVPITEIAEINNIYKDLKVFYKKEIVPILDSFKDNLKSINDDKIFCNNLIASVKDKIFNYHKRKSFSGINGEFIGFHSYSIREGEDKTQHVKNLNMYASKIMKINENLRKEFEELKIEREKEVDLLFQEVEKTIDSFKELKDEIATIEVKPINYIISN